jgi:PAS domain-containing protein
VSPGEHRLATSDLASTEHWDFAAAFFDSPVPSAIVDESGRISRPSEAFSLLVPETAGREVSEIFSLPTSDTRTQLESRKLFTSYGTYQLPSGELSPVAARFIPLPGQRASLLVIDRGDAFRQAEAARLSSAPYAILRLNHDGRIAFANQAAVKILSPGCASLIGTEFGLLLDAESRPRAAAALCACLRNQPVAPLVTHLAGLHATGYPFALMFMPDLGPGERILGAIAVFQELGLGQARDKVKLIALGSDPWRVRLKKILSIVSTIIPFDQATFGLYAEDVTLFRAVHVEPKVAKPWPTLWIRLLPGIRDWLEGERTWAEDLTAFVQAFEGLAEDPVTKLHLDAGFRSFVTLPVIGPKGATSSLSLASKRPNAYHLRELAILRELDLGELLLLFERDISDERDRFVRELRALIRDAPSVAAVAKIVVERLQSFFQWDHVAIYLVDQFAGRFRLLQQSFTEGCGLAGDYSQPLDTGMLGYTLARNPDPGADRRIALTKEDTSSAPDKYQYLPVNNSLNSALTIPVRLNNEWRWILDFEARVTDAFHGPDVDAVQEIVSQLEGDLERLYQSDLNVLLLQTSPQGIVVVGSDGAILNANRSARAHLFGTFDEETRLGNIQDYADKNDPTTPSILAGQLSDTSRRLQIRDRNGKVHAVLGNRSALAEEYQSSVWFFTDLDNLNWNVSYRYLREVVNDVAQQIRGPLMLASIHLKAAAGPSGGKVAAAIDRAFAEIGKADITFERLAEGLSIVEQPIRRKQRVDLRECLLAVYQNLPHRDQQHIDLQIPSDEAFVQGDLARLQYAFKSIVEYLLRCRPVDNGNDAKIALTLSLADQGISVLVAILGFAIAFDEPEAEVHDALWVGTQTARDDASLGLKGITRIFDAHGATLTKGRWNSQNPNLAPVWIRFQVTFPNREVT